MAKHGWKKVREPKSEAQAIELLGKASLLISEAQSNINAVQYANLPESKMPLVARKMFDAVKGFESLYHEYLMGRL